MPKKAPQTKPLDQKDFSASYRGWTVKILLSGRAYGSARYFNATGLMVAKAKVPESYLKALAKKAIALKSKLPPYEKPKQIVRSKKGTIEVGVAQDTNKNDTAGQPTKYDSKYCDQLIAYFDVQRYHDIIIEEESKPSKWGTGTRKKMKRVANDLPQFSAFARKIGVSYRTLLEWSKRAYLEDVEDETGAHKKGELVHPEFAEAYETAKDLQKEFLIENGLQGHYPPASFIFVAKNITDMKDVTEVVAKDGGKAGDDIDDEELDEAIFNHTA